MGEEEPKKATENTETETPDPVPATPPLQATDHDDQDHKAVEKKEEKKDQEKEGKEEEKKDVAVEKKSLSPVPQEKAVQKIADPVVEKNQEVDRDAVLAQVETEKRLALIKAWEESEKTKSENKAYKKLSAVGAWENSKRAAVEAELRAIEEKLAKKRAEYTEKMKNKVAEVHKLAEEKRAFVEANRREECLKVEETAAKFRASGFAPKKLLRCFGQERKMSFSGTQQKCKACDKTVHFIDALSADGVVYHKTCFKCSHCNGLLVISSYSSMDGVLYCKPHFEQLFKEMGSFTKKFQSAKPQNDQLTRAPSKLSSLFSGTQDKCAVCTKTVYPLEKVTVEGEFYHKSCFRCSHGGCFLTPSSYAALDGILYCKHHFAQLFKEKGSYNHLIKTASIKKNGQPPNEQKPEATQGGTQVAVDP